MSGMVNFPEGMRGVLMAHVIAGFPSERASFDAIVSLIAGGAGAIELQIPFSDPLADGPIIMRASEVALREGANVEMALALARRVTVGFPVPVAIMSYLNPVFRYGLEKFVDDAVSSGISAFIMPDTPFDSPEGRVLLRLSRKKGVHMIAVVSPGMDDERLRFLAVSATGFVYCTTRRGTTGADGRFEADLAAFVLRLKSIFAIPIVLGFGIRTPSDVASGFTIADAVVVGSVFVEALQRGETLEPLVRKLIT